MDAPRVELWRRAEVLFERALKRSPSQQQGFIERACVGDRELRAAVASLLAHDQAMPTVPSLIEMSLDSEPAAQDLWIGRRLGVYRLLRTLGHGGMGRIYLGERDDGEVEQRVAVKLIHDGDDRPALLRRFRRERQILARLSHPNIAHFLDGGTTESGGPYLVLEYIEGLPIDEYCAIRRSSVRQRLRLLLQVCRAVEHAHRNLIVHRDLKPGNILVTDQGDVKLLDFGIAKQLETSGAEAPRVTATQNRFLTLRYASPEQLAGEVVTTADDQYALGVLLYRLLTGLMPFESVRGPLLPSAAAVAEQSPGAEHPTESPSGRAQARGTTPSRLARQLRGGLDNIVLRCLRRHPEHRYGSIAKLAEDLRRHLDGLPVEASPRC